MEKRANLGFFNSDLGVITNEKIKLELINVQMWKNQVRMNKCLNINKPN